MKVECPNYTSKEWQCKCGCGKSVVDELVVCCQALIYILQNYFGVPVRHLITSGARCEEHNKKVGGSPNSMHLQGKAVDGVFQRRHGDNWIDIDCNTVANVVLKSGLFKGIGYQMYNGRFIHLDLRQNLNIW